MITSVKKWSHRKEVTESQNNLGRKGPLEVSAPTSCFGVRSGCSGPYLAEFWVSLRTEIPQPHSHCGRKNGGFFSCPAGIPLAAACGCCLLSFHCAPPGSVLLHPLYNHRLGSWRQQSEASLAFFSLSWRNSAPTSFSHTSCTPTPNHPSGPLLDSMPYFHWEAPNWTQYSRCNLASAEWEERTNTSFNLTATYSLMQHAYIV